MLQNPSAKASSQSLKKKETPPRRERCILYALGRFIIVMSLSLSLSEQQQQQQQCILTVLGATLTGDQSRRNGHSRARSLCNRVYIRCERVYSYMHGRLPSSLFTDTIFGKLLLLLVLSWTVYSLSLSLSRSRTHCRGYRYIIRVYADEIGSVEMSEGIVCFFVERSVCVITCFHDGEILRVYGMCDAYWLYYIIYGWVFIWWRSGLLYVYTRQVCVETIFWRIPASFDI